jgi:predicted acyl esterase
MPSISAIYYRRLTKRRYDPSHEHAHKIAFSSLATANTFMKGHRVRLEVSSRNSARYAGT